ARQAREAARGSAREGEAHRRAAGQARRWRHPRRLGGRSPRQRDHRPGDAHRRPRRQGAARHGRPAARPHPVGRRGARERPRRACGAARRGHQGPHRSLPRRQHHQAAGTAGRRGRRWPARLRAGRRQESRSSGRSAARRVRPAGRGKRSRALSEPAVAPVPMRFGNQALFRELLGQHDEYVKLLERELDVRIEVGDGTLTIHGDTVEAELATRTITQLYGLLEQGYPIFAADVEYALRILSGDRSARLKDIFLDTVFISAHKRVITPKSVNQKAYIDAIRNYDLVFGIGPAGTGKTYLAMAM